MFSNQSDFERQLDDEKRKIPNIMILILSVTLGIVEIENYSTWKNFQYVIY